MKRLLAAATAALSLSLIAACGGGGEGGHPLSIDDGAPEAYTVGYLNAHPDQLVQPEHMILARLDPKGPDGGRQSVALHIREAMTLALGGGGAAEAPVDVAIENGAGAVQQEHRPGDAVTTFALQPGNYRLVLTPTSQMTASQMLFLKLADTPTQAARRLQAVSVAAPPTGGLLGAAPAGPTPLGMISGDTCFNCSFDGADLSNEDFTDTFLGGSSFTGTTLFNTNFTRTYCYQCTFLINSAPGTTQFTDADLDAASVWGNFSGVVFSGAQMKQASLRVNFEYADFTPSARGVTTLQGADLTSAVFLFAKLQYADLTGAKLNRDIQFYDSYAPLPSNAFKGVKFDNVTPSTLFTTIDFKGMDLTDASFAGMDLSHYDLSVANGVTVTPAGLAQAILTNGTVGTNLAGQDFGTSFTSWGGTVDNDASGKDLRYVNLSNAGLYGADLTRANLSGAILVGANLSNANLYAAVLAGAQLGVEAATGTQRAADLSNAYMPLANFSDADLRSVDLSTVHLYTLDGSSGVSLQRARLDSATLQGAILVGADFTQASLNDTDLSGAILVNANFSAATLTNTKFNGASLQGALFGSAASVFGSDFNNTAIAGNGVVLSTSSPYQFTEFDGVAHSYAYSATALGPISTTSGLVCPSGANGPCTTAAMLTAATQPPYPPKPTCIALRKWDYKNCLPGWTPPSS